MDTAPLASPQQPQVHTLTPFSCLLSLDPFSGSGKKARVVFPVTNTLVGLGGYHQRVLLIVLEKIQRRKQGGASRVRT